MPDLIAQHLPVELAIVGAGPAGLAAAAEASDLGVPVTLIDLFPRPGGQYFKQTPPELDGVPDATPGRCSTASPDGYAGHFRHGGLGHLPRRRRVPPVPLWPGGHPAASAGQEGHPGARRTRPASALPGLDPAGRDHGGSRLDPCETPAAAARPALPVERHRSAATGAGAPSPRCRGRGRGRPGRQSVPLARLAARPAAWGQWERLGEGWAAWRTLRKAGAPLRWGHVVRRAEGEGQVERAVIGPVGGRCRRSRRS